MVYLCLIDAQSYINIIFIMLPFLLNNGYKIVVVKKISIVRNRFISFMV